MRLDVGREESPNDSPLLLDLGVLCGRLEARKAGALQEALNILAQSPYFGLSSPGKFRVLEGDLVDDLVVRFQAPFAEAPRLVVSDHGPGFLDFRGLQ